MALAKPLEVRIEKQYDDNDFLRYQVKYTGADAPGEIDAVIEQMKESQMIAQPSLGSLGIAPNEKVVDLSYFYPHTQKHHEKSDFKNRGIGTAALNRVIEDAREQSAVAIYCITYSPSLRKFLPNRGFEPSIYDPTVLVRRID